MPPSASWARPAERCRGRRRRRRRRRRHRRRAGARASCARAAPDGSWSSTSAPPARARAPARPASCARRAAPRPPSGSRCGPRRSTAASASELGIDSGFVAQGYFMPCFTEAEVAGRPRADGDAAGARARRALARPRRGRRAEPDDGDAACTSAARSPPATGGIDPPRNVLAYTVALAVDGVQLRERRDVHRPGAGRRRPASPACAPSAGTIATRRVVLTGGPELAEVGAAGRRADPGRRRAAPGRGDRAAPRPRRRAGCRWSSTCRPACTGGPEEQGILFGMSNPAEAPGPGRARSTTRTSRRCASGSPSSCPVTRGLGLRRVWAATIDYTPDHLPILGPGARRRRRPDRRRDRRRRRPATG